MSSRTVPDPTPAHTPVTTPRSAVGNDVLLLALLSALYLALELPTLRAFGILWDEQNDISVARSYVTSPAGWLAGSAEDPTQMRLPMYTVALAFGVLGRTDLHLARLVSCVVSLLTLFAVYAYARRFGRAQALLASALVATSPLFLAFSRVALTEGDAFVTAAMAWSIVLFASALDRPTVGRTALAGVALGLALSAKFIAVAVLPAFALAPWLVTPCGATDRRESGSPALVALASACALVCEMLMLGWFYWYRPRMPGQAGLTLLAWSCAAAIYALNLALVVRRRHQTVGRVTQPAIVALIAGATFILIPPVHLTSPVLLGSVKDMLLASAAPNPVLMVQSASLHALTLLFKPSIPVGILLWVAMALALWQWRVDPRVRLPLLAIMSYGAFLVKMPVLQTFYTMPIFPWLVVLAADRLVALWHARRTAAGAVLVACAVSVAVDLWRTFPHYQLNGYQWLGARYVLGLSTVSYRSVVQVTSDGVEQALMWLNQRAEPRDRVKTYIGPDHIVRAVSPAPAFTLVDGLRPPSPSVADSDYVITTLHADIRNYSPGGLRGGGSVFLYPYDRAALVRDFEPVFRVQRPFGLEFATVWQRKVRLAR